MTATLPDLVRLPAKNGPTFAGRPDTADAKAIAEVWDRKAYDKPRLGFGVRAGETVLDLGTNVGAFGVYARLVRQAGLVIGVEAEPVNAAIAAANFAEHIGESGSVLAAAVVPDGHPEPTVTLHVNHRPLALRRHSISKARRESHPVVVAAEPITRLVEQTGAQFLKINIEGAEIPILTTWTAPSTVRAVVAEWSFDVDDRLATLATAVHRLRDRFEHVHLSKRLPEGEVWPYYPPNLYLYAWNE